MRAVTVTAGLIVLLSTGVARADGSGHERAVAAFEEGRRYIEAGNCDAGITKLTESLRYEPSIGARVSLADCYEPGDALGAWKQLREAARLAYLNHDDRLASVEKRATALEPRLSLVRVVVPAASGVAGFAEPGFELRLDGELVDPFFYRDGLLAATPGGHELVATTRERKWSSTVAMEPGSTKVATVKLETDCAPRTTQEVVPVAPAAPSAPGGTRRAVANVLGGVGIAGIGAGVVYGLLSIQKRSDLQTACGGDTTRCTAPPGSLDVARESAQNAGTASIVGFVFGGAALAGAVTLYLTSERPGPTRGSLTLAPVVAKNQEGLAVVGRW